MTRYPFYTRGGAGPLFYMATDRQPVISIPIPQSYISASSLAGDTDSMMPAVVQFRWRITRPFEEFAYEAERDLTSEEFQLLWSATPVHTVRGDAMKSREV